MTEKPSPAIAEWLSQEEVAAFFRLHLQIHGPNWRGLGWQSQRSQQRRFAVLSEVGPLANAHVLDIGCGVGDLYKYLLRRRIPVNYTGFDILPEMVAHARTRYPEAQFEVRDALQGLGSQQFDYVLCSGAFNVRFRAQSGSGAGSPQRVAALQHPRRGDQFPQHAGTRTRCHPV